MAGQHGAGWWDGRVREALGGLTSTVGVALNGRCGAVVQPATPLAEGRVTVLLDGDDTPNSTKAAKLQRIWSF